MPDQSLWCPVHAMNHKCNYNQRIWDQESKMTDEQWEAIKPFVEREANASMALGAQCQRNQPTELRARFEADMAYARALKEYRLAIIELERAKGRIFGLSAVPS